MNAFLNRLSLQNAVLLVVDVQERLLPAIDGQQQVVANVGKMIEAARLLGLPMLVTEQYPAGLGRTCAPIRAALGEVPAIEKVRFSACVEPVLQRLKALKCSAVIVVGIEAHVCVQQTVLDLLREKYLPFVCADAVSSRRALDRDVALQRMRQAGAIVTTTESAIFELLVEAGTERFKQMLRIVK